MDRTISRRLQAIMALALCSGSGCIMSPDGQPTPVLDLVCDSVSSALGSLIEAGVLTLFL